MKSVFESGLLFLFLNHLQNLVGKASHSLDSWVAVLLVYVMKGDDRNLIGLADLFTDSLISSFSSEFRMK